MAVKPNIDNYNFKDYRNPDAYFGGEMPERGTYRKALKSVADEIEHQANVTKKTYWGGTPAAKQFRIELNNIWSHSSVRDTLSPSNNSNLKEQPELLQAVEDVRKYGQELLKELEPLTKWNGKEWVNSVNESVLEKLTKSITEALDAESEEFTNTLFNWLDEKATSNGFGVQFDNKPYEIAYKREGNYEHRITFSTEYTDRNLTYKVFRLNEDKPVIELSWSFVVDVKDIDNAFKSISNYVEGME